MNKKLADRWAKALLSGKFKQGYGRLYDKRNDTYCCLGVLGRICGLSEANMRHVALHNHVGRGLSSSTGETINGEELEIKRIGTFDSLAQANDEGVSFKYIAACIKKNYKNL